MQKNIKHIAKLGWLQRWSGSYTFISCSFWGPQYYRVLKQKLGINFRHTLFVHKKGTVDFYVQSQELHALGSWQAKMANLRTAKNYSRLIKHNTDVLVKQMYGLMHRLPSWAEYKKFLTAFENHLVYHSFIKETVDYLPANKLKSLLPYFVSGRKYSERIYSDTEVFFRAIAKNIAKKEKRDPKLLTCLTQAEFETYLKTGKLPADKLLKSRYTSSCLYFENGKVIYFFGPKVKAMEKAMLRGRQKHKKIISGISAFPGKIRAKCRVVPDPFSYKTFKAGEILVTGTTRPEFFPLFRLAGGVITDSGGILSHAAITARELKKPCIIDTQIATKILKDGQLVELDAYKGIIKILN